MINVAQVRAHIQAIEGEVIAVPKVQLIEMLAEVEVGQHARRLNTNVRSMLTFAPSTPGMHA